MYKYDDDGHDDVDICHILLAVIELASSVLDKILEADL